MFFYFLYTECPPFNRITLGRDKSYNNKRIIKLTNVFNTTHMERVQQYLISIAADAINLDPISGGHYIIILFEIAGGKENILARIDLKF